MLDPIEDYLSNMPDPITPEGEVKMEEFLNKLAALSQQFLQDSTSYFSAQRLRPRTLEEAQYVIDEVRYRNTASAEVEQAIDDYIQIQVQAENRERSGLYCARVTLCVLKQQFLDEGKRTLRQKEVVNTRLMRHALQALITECHGIASTEEELPELANGVHRFYQYTVYFF